jgi:DNA-binding LacI/PurR family transcriptional regulator
VRPVHRLSLPEQVAACLREGIKGGRWGDQFPGEVQLATELDVSRNTARRALQILEKEGLVVRRGLGRSRGITPAGSTMASQRPLRVAILRNDSLLDDNPQTALILANVLRSLEAAGYDAFECRTTQVELRHDVPQMTRQLIAAGADAWVIEAGSRPLLEWCASQQTPCLALYGRTQGLQIARTGPDTVSAYATATRALIALGHRRIVLIVREEFRRPPVGGCELAFLTELETHGIPAGPYNLPEWTETPAGFAQLMESLFRTTPPTAVIVDEACWFIAALAFMVRRGLCVPEQVSLVAGESVPILDMCSPRLAQMRWDNRLMVRRIVRWVDAVRKGNPDRRILNIPAEFVPGGSIGPLIPSANVAIE